MGADMFGIGTTELILIVLVIAVTAAIISTMGKRRQ
jgi:hypothetical protein